MHALALRDVQNQSFETVMMEILLHQMVSATDVVTGAALLASFV